MLPGTNVQALRAAGHQLLADTGRKSRQTCHAARGPADVDAEAFPEPPADLLHAPRARVEVPPEQQVPSASICRAVDRESRCLGSYCQGASCMFSCPVHSRPVRTPRSECGCSDKA